MGTVSIPKAAKSEALNQSCSTVCSVCEGIGEEDHPRSKTITDIWYSGNPNASDDSKANNVHGQFYIYLHYPDTGFLRSSYKLYGCQTCRLILSLVLSLFPEEWSVTANPSTQGEQDKLATFDITQDTYEAASIVSSAEISQGVIRIEGCGSGRVALCFGLHTEPCGGPRAFDASKRNMPSLSIHAFDAFSVGSAIEDPTLIWRCSPGQSPFYSTKIDVNVTK